MRTPPAAGPTGSHSGRSTGGQPVLVLLLLLLLLLPSGGRGAGDEPPAQEELAALRWAHPAAPLAAEVADAGSAQHSSLAEVAYASFLHDASEENWLRGLNVLRKSLQGAGSAVPNFVCLTGPLVNAAGLAAVAAAGWTPEPIAPEAAIVRPSAAAARAVARAGIDTSKLYNKLHVFNLTRFHRVVFVDADAMALANLDELFSRPCPPGGGLCAAAPDVMPPDKFNTGVMLVAPSAAVFERMLAVVPRIEPVDGSDQGFLHQFYPDWWEWPATRRLPAVYNAGYKFSEAEGHFISLRKRLKVVHFYGPFKPWHASTGQVQIPMVAVPLVYLWYSLLRAPADRARDVFGKFDIESDDGFGGRFPNVLEQP